MATTTVATTAAGSTSGVEAERQLLKDALRHIQNNEANLARDLLQTAVDRSAFNDLSPPVRHWAITALGSYDLDNAAYGKAEDLFKTAVTMEEADGSDWSNLSNAAYNNEDIPVETDALIVIAARWPSAFADYHGDYLVKLAGRLDKDPKNKSRRAELLSAIFDSGWKSDNPFSQHEYLWYQLALARLAAGDQPGAALAAERIKADEIALLMRADKRFDAIVATSPGHFDPVVLASRRLAMLKAEVAAQPKRLEGVQALALQMMTLGQNAEALAIVDAALKQALPADGSNSAYTDTGSWLNWIMDTRERLLMRLGRYDDAVAQELTAAKYAERGGTNISQILNLGLLYVDLGRPQAALDEVADANTRPASDYGRMVLNQIRTCAYVQLHNKGGAATALSYLEEHRTDAQDLLIDAYVCVGDSNAAANAMIAALSNPDNSAGMLMAMQIYEPNSGATAEQAENTRRVRQIEERADVRTAAAKFGHIDSYALHRPQD